MKHVRSMIFEMRTAVPVSAGCIVANAMRETLSALLAQSIELRLFEPAAPSRAAWNAIAKDALLYGVDGAAARAAIVLRRADALRFAGAAFGETASGERPLSALENSVVERIVRALAPALSSVCAGRPEQLTPEAIPVLDGFTTYIELQVERPFTARIGVALAQHAAPSRGATVPEEALLDLEVEVVVRTEGIAIPASELASLEPGAIVPITLTTGLTALASVAGSPIARGECGVRGNRLALAIGLAPCTEGGSEPDHDR